MTYFCSKEFVTGHIEAKKGYWHMVFNNGVDNMKKRIRWSKTTGLPCKGNKRKAEAMLRSHLEQANSITLLPDNMKFYELINKWIEYVAILVEENTHVKYQYAAKHLVPYFQRKAINVQQLKPVHISDYYVDKIQRIENGQGLSPNTLLTHRTVMIGALKFAINYLGIITDNVVKIVPPPKKEVYIPMFYNEIQINEVFRKVQDEIIAPAIYLAASYGLRRSEVLGIKWDAIDFERKTITIRHTVTKVGNKDVAKDRVKTKASLRSLHLTEGAERYLKKLYLTHLKNVGASELGRVDTTEGIQR